MTEDAKPTAEAKPWSPHALEQAAWLENYQKTTSLTWKDLEKRIGRPSSTLGLFASLKYAGRCDEVADKVEAFRRQLVQQDSARGEIPSTPGYYETETSVRITTLLSVAKEGLITAGAFEAGLGKSMTARHYRDIYPQVYLATMRKSTAGVNTMQQQVLKSMGVRNATGTPQKLSDLICEKAASAHLPLLIIDEAQHLSESALEEARSWNDEVDLGIAILGNAGFVQKMLRFPQLYSRLEMKTQQVRPFRADAEAMCQAWEVFDKQQVQFLHEACQRGGGLRRGTKILRLGTRLARGQGMPLGLDHLKLASSTLYSDGGAS